MEGNIKVLGHMTKVQIKQSSSLINFREHTSFFTPTSQEPHPPRIQKHPPIASLVEMKEISKVFDLMNKVQNIKVLH